MVGTRDHVNAKAGTRRMLSHGLVAPNDPRNLDMMEWQAKDLKIDSWKGYTADGISGRYPSGGYYGGWYLDDAKVAYPMYDKARKLGIKTFCIHKGLAVIWFDEKYCRLHDLEPAALANPDLNFIIYHSGYPWVDDLANITRFKRNPALNVANNIYAELGSTFAMTVTGAPLEAAHVLGKLVTHVGSDRIMWGSDSTWWGSPQWQIDAFRRFQIPEDIQKGYGYKPIRQGQGADPRTQRGPRLRDQRRADHETARAGHDLERPRGDRAEDDRGVQEVCRRGGDEACVATR